MAATTNFLGLNHTECRNCFGPALVSRLAGVTSSGGGPTLTITSGAPPATGTFGVPYGPFTETASGGSGTFQWTVSGVPGVTIGSASGVLGGTPTTAGVYSLMVTAADASSPSSTVSQSYPVTIGYPPLVITSVAPPAYGASGQAYGPFTFAGAGGSSSFVWSVSGVPGLTVNSGTGVLSGSPTVTGNLTLTVTLTNASSLSQSISVNYPINVLAITSGAPPANGTVGVAYGPFTATATGGTGSYLWSASGVAGVTIGTGTGVLSGMPTTPGSGFTLTVTVTDTTTHFTVSQNYTVNIAGAALVITTTSLPGGIQGQAYSARLGGAGGSGNYTWTISGITGLVVNATSGAISGSPSVSGKPHAERDAGRLAECLSDSRHEAVYNRHQFRSPQHHQFRHWAASRQARQ